MPAKTPSILFIQTDQLSAEMIGSYGSKIASTPNIDALADRGVSFDSAYCNFPLCAPSRFSMLSGQLNSKIGAYDNAAEFPSSVPTVTHYLRRMGYQTCLIGKMHFIGADQLHGFEERRTSDIYPSDFVWTGDWTDIRAKHANDARSFSEAGVCVRNVQMDYDDEVTHRAERKLYDLARSDDERPFFLLVSFTHPHDPYQCLQAHWDRYRHDEIEMPNAGTVAGDPHTHRLRVQTGLAGFDMTEEHIRTARHAYLGSVSYVDDQIGRLLRVLRRVGLDDDTAVVFTTDHGDMLGEHGLWYKKSFFEQSCRVPLIVTTPDHAVPSRVTKNVSLVDLLPTLMDIAGTGDAPEPIEPVDGLSLVPLMGGSGDTRDDVVYGEMLAESALGPLLMIKRGPWKYIHGDPDPAQLFNLETDPLEVENLSGRSEHAEIEAALATEVCTRWEPTAIKDAVLASQKRRLFLREVLAIGEKSCWDYVAPDEAAANCLRERNYSDWAYSNVLR